jgi:hypothetical protein
VCVHASAAMPEANRDKWTPLAAVASQCVVWAEGREAAHNGGLYSFVTHAGTTTVVLRPFLGQ